MRMEEREFSKADQLYQEVATARYTMQLLVADLHRMLSVGYMGTRK